MLLIGVRQLYTVSTPLWGVLVVLLLTFALPMPLMAQQANQQQQEGQEFDQLNEELEQDAAEVAAEGGGGGGASFWRLGVLEVVSLRFNDPHPYKQLTGSSAFNEPAVSMLMSTDYGEKVQDQETEGYREIIMHNLPPFSVEYVAAMDFFFMYGFSIEYYHTTTLDFDAVVARNAQVSPKSRIPLLKMKSYYDMVSFNAFLFTDPTTDYLSFSFGLGLAQIEGSYRAGFRGRLENNFVRRTFTEKFQAFPVSFRRMALDLQGETLGFRFAVITINDEPVITDNTFMNDQLIDETRATLPHAGKEAHFEGAMLRAAMIWKL